MARRRPPGTGSISKHKSGKFIARFVLTYKESGTPILKSKTWDLKPDAERWLAEMRLKYFGQAPTDYRLTVAEWYYLWLEDIKQNRSENTYRGYKRYVGKHAIPILGQLDMMEDNRLAVKRWATQLKQTVTPDTYARAVKNTSTMFNMALELGKCNLNPVMVVKDAKKPPKRFRKRRWTVEEISKVLDYAHASKHPWRYYVHVGLTTGMRKEELLGLRWADIDALECSITVAQVVVYPGNAEVVIREAPKTEDSYRQVYLDDETLKMLREQKTLVEAKKHSGWLEQDLVFPGRYGNPPNDNRLRKSFYKLCDDAGVPRIWIMDLRSTWVSLSRGKVPEHIAAKRAGHSEQMRQKIYTQSVEDEERAAALSLTELLSN